MRIHFVVHESFEAPGAYEQWVSERGYVATYSRVYLHEALPESVESIDLLAVMGGPQSPTTTLAECPHFNAAAECDLILRCVAARIIEYGDLVYGFQCHKEFTPEVVELLIAASARELATLTAHRFVQQPDALRANDYAAMNRKLFGFLDRLMASYAA
ncbi:hypothetical protein [Pseudoduganella sp. RAF53_2]|uniref:hypothetical protein n=1 Tax=unclassified Pseudoduganella TaxID=2637179 RepID=UPI003F9D2258